MDEEKITFDWNPFVKSELENEETSPEKAGEIISSLIDSYEDVRSVLGPTLAKKVLINLLVQEMKKGENK